MSMGRLGKRVFFASFAFFFLKVFLLTLAASEEIRGFRQNDGLALLKRLEAVPAHGILFASVIEMDPAKFRVKTVSSDKLLGQPLANLPQIVAALPQALVVVNAGFFSMPDGQKLGLYMEEGALGYYYDHDSLDRVFYVSSGGKADIVARDDFDASGVLSAVAGKSTGFVDDPTARTAACMTRQGRVRFIAAYPVRTLAGMEGYLRTEENCVKTVHLDGGGSTQMAFRAGDDFSIGLERRPECQKVRASYPAFCYRKVATFLVVLPR